VSIDWYRLLPQSAIQRGVRGFLNKPRTSFVRQYGNPVARDFVIPRSVLDDYLEIPI
jgi:hypothetical protein